MTPQAEFGPDVFDPTDDDYDPDRVIRDASRNALIAKGAALAKQVTYLPPHLDHAQFPLPDSCRWVVMAKVNGRIQEFREATLTDALSALAEAVGDAT